MHLAFYSRIYLGFHLTVEIALTGTLFLLRIIFMTNLISIKFFALNNIMAKNLQLLHKILYQITVAICIYVCLCMYSYFQQSCQMTVYNLQGLTLHSHLNDFSKL